MDIAPTVFHLLGCGVPKYMNGRVLTELFKERFRAVNYIEMDGEVTKADMHGFCYNPDEEEKVKKRLRSLGHID